MRRINFLKYLVCFVFPSRCKVCNKVVYIGKDVCDGCKAELRKVPENISLMLVSNPNVNTKLGFKPRYDGVIAPHYHEDGSKQMIYNLKFNNRKDLVSVIGSDMYNSYELYLKSKGIDYINSNAFIGVNKSGTLHYDIKNTDNTFKEIHEKRKKVFTKPLPKNWTK